MISKKFLFILSFISTLFLLSSCSTNQLKEKGDWNYINEIKQWHQNRIERLKQENGWLNLVGLYWLKEGENTFGSGDNNYIVFPSKVPKSIGTFYLKDGKVSVEINPGVNVTTEGNPVSKMDLKDDLSDNPTVMQLGSFRWFVINRNGRMGIRLRDIDAPLVKNFKGIDTYPINEDWRITADFHPFDRYRVIEVPNIINSVEKDTVIGELTFTIKGKNYKLLPIKEGNEFFIIFADETNGTETYGAGRFLYTSLPDSNNKVIVDFNKAYNPPCAFTKYATCPLPPKENYLHLKITAGEKKYGEEP
jgi:uncharacterized protein